MRNASTIAIAHPTITGAVSSFQIARRMRWSVAWRSRPAHGCCGRRLLPERCSISRAANLEGRVSTTSTSSYCCIRATGLISIPAVPCQSGAARRRRPATRCSRIAAKPSRARKMRAPAPPARASRGRSLREDSGGVSATACGFAGGVNGAFGPAYEPKRSAFGLRGNAFQSSCGGAAGFGSPDAAGATGASIATKTTQANATRNKEASELQHIRMTMCSRTRFV